MSKAASKKRAGASKGKLALVGVLCLVMAAVWGNALMGSGKPASVARQNRKPTPRPIGATPQPAATTNQTSNQQLADWPEMALASAVLNDPFAKPSWAIADEPTQTSTASGRRRTDSTAAVRETLAEQGASMIVIAGDKKIATIGELEVRIGDTVAGYEVVDITPNGVVLDEPRQQAGKQ